jgi:2-dehydro-3-deoxygluconokinase
MSKLVAGLGEMLMRLTAPQGIRLVEAPRYEVNFGGAEANVLMSLVRLGYQARYITKMPKDDIGEACMRHLYMNQIDTRFIARSDDPLGIYYLEEGEGVRPSKVSYNRKHSAACHMKPTDYDFEKALKGVSVLHVSGITLAISSSACETAIACMKQARKMGIKVSFDFNYRSMLISIEKAKEIYPRVARLADIVFASPWDIQTLLGFEPEETDLRKLFMDACRKYDFDYIFAKKREIISARSQKLTGYAYSKTDSWTGDEVTFGIFDRMGAGDSYSAGVICSLLEKPHDGARAIAYGTANCVLKQTCFGDQALFTKPELEEFIKTHGREEVKR